MPETENKGAQTTKKKKMRGSKTEIINLCVECRMPVKIAEIFFVVFFSQYALGVKYYIHSRHMYKIISRNEKIIVEKHSKKQRDKFQAS